MNYNRENRGPQRQREQSAPEDFSRTTSYYDDKGVMKREVFVEWPKDVAMKIRVSRTNLRRAYDFVAAIRFRVRSHQHDEVEVRRAISEGMGHLHRFVVYQAGRDSSWREAQNFFTCHYNAVGTNPEKFEGFFQLFQSVMAYLRRS